MIKKALIDLNGTLHIENSVTDGAIEALEKLRRSNIEVRFVTNTTKECRASLYKRLENLGFHLDIDEVISSLTTARNLVARENLHPMLLIDSKALDEFSDLPSSNEDFDSVVIGLAPEHFHYETLNKAFRLIKSGAKLIAIHESRYFKTESGLSLGPGCFVKGLEYATDSKAVLVGKPNRDFFMAALESTPPSDVVMIGDDVRDDIEAAQQIGIKGILVKTGKYRENDENFISPLPMATVDNFSKAVDTVLSFNAASARK